jgi:hypothetical protein
MKTEVIVFGSGVDVVVLEPGGEEVVVLGVTDEFEPPPQPIRKPN